MYYRFYIKQEPNVHVLFEFNKYGKLKFMKPLLVMEYCYPMYISVFSGLCTLIAYKCGFRLDNLLSAVLSESYIRSPLQTKAVSKRVRHIDISV